MSFVRAILVNIEGADANEAGPEKTKVIGTAPLESKYLINSLLNERSLTSEKSFLYKDIFPVVL